MNKSARRVKPWNGSKYACPECGRLTIHTGSCAFCGTPINDRHTFYG